MILINFVILIIYVTTCIAHEPEMFMQENDNFGGTKEDYYMNNFKGQYRYSFENPNTIKQLQDGFADGGKVGFYSYVGPDGRFYITCYTAVNGYRAKSIIVVTDMPYHDLQEFCQKKFNVATNSFNDLSDVKGYLDKKKNKVILTSSSTSTSTSMSSTSSGSSTKNSDTDKKTDSTSNGSQTIISVSKVENPKTDGIVSEKFIDSTPKQKQPVPSSNRDRNRKTRVKTDRSKQATQSSEVNRNQNNKIFRGGKAKKNLTDENGNSNQRKTDKTWVGEIPPVDVSSTPDTDILVPVIIENLNEPGKIETIFESITNAEIDTPKTTSSKSHKDNSKSSSSESTADNSKSRSRESTGDNSKSRSSESTGDNSKSTSSESIPDNKKESFDTNNRKDIANSKKNSNSNVGSDSGIKKIPSSSQDNKQEKKNRNKGTNENQQTNKGNSVNNNNDHSKDVTSKIPSDKGLLDTSTVSSTNKNNKDVGQDRGTNENQEGKNKGNSVNNNNDHSKDVTSKIPNDKGLLDTNTVSSTNNNNKDVGQDRGSNSEIIVPTKSSENGKPNNEVDIDSTGTIRDKSKVKIESSGKIENKLINNGNQQHNLNSLPNNSINKKVMSSVDQNSNTPIKESKTEINFDKSISNSKNVNNHIINVPIESSISKTTNTKLQSSDVSTPSLQNMRIIGMRKTNYKTDSQKENKGNNDKTGNVKNNGNSDGTNGDIKKNTATNSKKVGSQDNLVVVGGNVIVSTDKSKHTHTTKDENNVGNNKHNNGGKIDDRDISRVNNKPINSNPPDNQLNLKKNDYDTQCVGQLVTKIVTQPAHTVTITQTIQPTQTQRSTISVPTALSTNSCRAKIVVENSNKKIAILNPTEDEMKSIRERAAVTLGCGMLSFLSK